MESNDGERELMVRPTRRLILQSRIANGEMFFQLILKASVRGVDGTRYAEFVRRQLVAALVHYVFAAIPLILSRNHFAITILFRNVEMTAAFDRRDGRRRLLGHSSIARRK